MVNWLARSAFAVGSSFAAEAALMNFTPFASKRAGEIEDGEENSQRFCIKSTIFRIHRAHSECHRRNADLPSSSGAPLLWVFTFVSVMEGTLCDRATVRQVTSAASLSARSSRNWLPAPGKKYAPELTVPA